MGWLIGVSVVWGLLLSLVAGAAGGMGVIAMLGVAWAPLAACVWYALHRAAERERTHMRAMEQGGVAPGQGFDHTEGASGIGLNGKDRLITLHEGGFVKTYPYSDVRSFERKKLTGSARLQDQMKDAAASGMFLEMRDTEKPMWRVEMKELGTQQRWLEILRQEVNEGGAAA
jgi:hypothetical protein